MRLSMWMIANQLINFDIETDIQKNAPVNLRSARRAYATECVHVYQRGKDVVCCSDDGAITIKDIDIGYAFEIIQSIFDTYDDWSNSILESAAQSDFQTVVDDSWHAFHSPITLLNSDFKVLAMSSREDLGEMDEEWRYLKENGFSSIQAIKDINKDRDWLRKRSKSDAQRFHFSNKKKLSNCLSVSVVYDNVIYGRINVLEKDRMLNEGDVQLLNHLSRGIAPYLNLYYVNHLNLSSHNVFYEMLRGRQPDRRAFENRLGYKQWMDSDTFMVMVIDFEGADSMMHVCMEQLDSPILSTELVIYHHSLVAILNKTRNDWEKSRKELTEVAERCDRPVGVSLPFERLGWLEYYYRQACAAMRYGEMFGGGGKHMCYKFYDYAILYLMETASGKKHDQLCACHPDVVRMIRESCREGEDERLNTLYVYLRNDCSPTRTSQQLYLHRNTLLYRLKKIMDELEFPIEQKQDKDYMLFSIQMMRLYRKKYASLLEEFALSGPEPV